MAKGAAEVAPNVYKVLFENDRVRLLEVRMKPGEESAMHSHPDYLLYALSGGTVKLTAGSGESGEVDIAAGDAMWRDAEEHSALNTGTTELVAMFFELNSTTKAFRARAREPVAAPLQEVRDLIVGGLADLLVYPVQRGRRRR